MDGAIKPPPEREREKKMSTESKKVTLVNDFHNTEINVVVTADTQYSATWVLSARQCRRVREALCNDNNCACGNEIAIRGRHENFRFDSSNSIDDQDCRLIGFRFFE